MKLDNSVSVMVPLKAEYVSIVRLTASGIASRMGFDYDAIEDIKVAISEVLSKIIERQWDCDRIEIRFDYLEDNLAIIFRLPGDFSKQLFGDDADDFAFAIISSLMDSVAAGEEDDIVLSMSKKLERAV